MTEITRVPLLPIAKGSLAKLWIGAIVAIAAGAALAWFAMPSMVSVKTIKAGEGPSPTLSDVAIIKYKGMLKDGTVFDQQEQAPMPLQGVIPGFSKALMQMQAGGKYRIVIPAKLGYGDRQVGPIPANSDLTFDIELHEFMPMEQFQQRMAMMRQMQQMQQGQQGQQGRGGPGAGADMPPSAPVQ